MGNQRQATHAEGASPVHAAATSTESERVDEPGGSYQGDAHESSFVPRRSRLLLRSLGNRALDTAGFGGGIAPTFRTRRALELEQPADTPLESLRGEVATHARTKLVRAVAEQATRGTSSTFPHHERIQQSFGRYDISDLAAHRDTHAHGATTLLQNRAFAYGRHVAFGGRTDLFTATHEAVHTLQQRAGVDIDRGVGYDDDHHERDANSIAGQVVRGRSVEASLDRILPASATAVAANGTSRNEVVQGDEISDFIEQLFTEAPLGVAVTVVFAMLFISELTGLTNLSGRIMAILERLFPGSAQPQAGPALAVALGVPQLGPVPQPLALPQQLQIAPPQQALVPTTGPGSLVSGSSASPSLAQSSGANQPIFVDVQFLRQGLEALPVDVFDASRGPIFFDLSVLGASGAQLGGLLGQSGELSNALTSGASSGGSQSLFIDVSALAQVLDLFGNSAGQVDISQFFVSRQRVLAPQDFEPLDAPVAPLALSGIGQLPQLEQPAVQPQFPAIELLQQAPQIDFLQLEPFVQQQVVQNLPQLQMMAAAFNQQLALSLPPSIQPTEEELEVAAILDQANEGPRNVILESRNTTVALAVAALHPDAQQALANLGQGARDAFLGLPPMVLIPLLQQPRSALITLLGFVSENFPASLTLPQQIRFVITEIENGAEPWEVAALPDPNAGAAPAFQQPNDPRSLPFLRENVSGLFPNFDVRDGSLNDANNPIYHLSRNALAGVDARANPNLGMGLGVRLFQFVPDNHQRALIAPAILRYLQQTFPELRIIRADLDQNGQSFYNFSFASVQTAAGIATPAAAGPAFGYRQAFQPAEDVRRQAIVRYMNANGNFPNLQITRAEVNDPRAIIYHLTVAELTAVHGNLSGRNVTQWGAVVMPANRGYINTTYMMPTQVNGLTRMGNPLSIGGEVFNDWFNPPDAQHGFDVNNIRLWIRYIENPPQELLRLSLDPTRPNRTYSSDNFAGRVVFNMAENLLITVFRENLG